MRTSRIAHFYLCLIALQICPTLVYGEGSTIGNIAAALRASPLMPIQKLEERALIPGTPVFGVVAERLHGVEILRVLDFKTCSIETPRQWFRSGTTTVTFTSQGRTELEDLRGFINAPAGSMDDIDSVDVKLKNVSSLNAPYPLAQENFATALNNGNCSTNGSQTDAAMIVRPVFADITLTFMDRSSTKHHAGALISKMRPAPEISNDGALYTITLSHRLIALKLGMPP